MPSREMNFQARLMWPHIAAYLRTQAGIMDHVNSKIGDELAAAADAIDRAQAVYVALMSDGEDG